MLIREASPQDLDEILELFGNTVAHINAKDYSPEQIDVWKNARNKEIWLKKIADQSFYIAIIDNRIVGFSSIATDGYLDFMYVHHEYQRKGIALNLLNQIELQAKGFGIKRIWSSVSITAQPFFSKYGFIQYDEEHKIVARIPFVNALMEKILKA